jgi:hypothetical protein
MSKQTEIELEETPAPADAGKRIRRLVAGDAFTRLVSASILKALIKEAGLRVAGDLHGAVLKEVGAVLARAARRCQANNRSTVRPDDL